MFLEWLTWIPCVQSFNHNSETNHFQPFLWRSLCVGDHPIYVYFILMAMGFWSYDFKVDLWITPTVVPTPQPAAPSLFQVPVRHRSHWSLRPVALRKAIENELKTLRKDLITQRDELQCKIDTQCATHLNSKPNWYQQEMCIFQSTICYKVVHLRKVLFCLLSS